MTDTPRNDARAGAIIGIDLGTTYSLACVLQAGRPVLIPNALGEHLTPSAVSVGDDGSFLIGAAARARVATHPNRTATLFKRDMGTDRVYTLGAHALRAPDLSALVLRSLREDAERYLGGPVSEAVVTVPAWFDAAQRQATRDAGAIAGLRVERIVNEPTAAALAYGLHAADRQLRIVVLDLGGGTFDVTVLEIIEGIVEIQATAGDTRLGGEDFADVLTEHVAARLPSPPADAVARARLREACELAKRRLSDREDARVVVPDLALAGGRRDVDEPVTRAELDAACAGLLDRMRGPILRALGDAGVALGDIDEVLLVGGATRMPSIGRLAASLFGRMPLRTLPADEAVAMGAAVQAALKAGDAAVGDMVVTDVAPFTLGVSIAVRSGAQIVEGVFEPLIERGTTVPCSRSKRVRTMFDGQTQMGVRVYQGEHAMCADNRLLGEYVVSGVPRRAAGVEGVDIRFSYDINGLLEVDTTILSTGVTGTLVIEQTPGRLTPAQIEASRAALARLKVHPRELLPNTASLARGDALYVELRGSERAALGEALAALRGALASEDPAEIALRREILNALVARLSG